MRVFGTSGDGAEFENVLIGVVSTDGQRVRRFEFFDVGDVDRALARFADLGEEPAARAV